MNSADDTQKEKPAVHGDTETKGHTQPPNDTANPSRSPRSCDPCEEHKEITCKTKRDWIDKVTLGLQGFGLAVLIVYTVFTGLMYCANKEAANAATSAANTAKNALESVQRAFVSPRRVEITPVPDKKSKQAIGVQIDLGWENNGTTPAKTLTQHISTRWDDKPIPDNFDFPDEWLPGEDHITKPTYIAPKSSLGGGIFIVPVPTLIAIQKGTRHVYYWGWAKYRDVFSQEHLTEICFELKSNGTPLGSTSNFPFRFDECTKHNCIDEDCKQ